MNPRLARSLSAAIVVMSTGASAATISCPAHAPAELGVKGAKLERVRVMSFPAGQAPTDDGSSAAMPPDDENDQPSSLIQVWKINYDAPRYVFAVDCIYAGTKKFRLDVRHVTQCVARWKQRKGELVKNTLVFRCE